MDFVLKKTANLQYNYGPLKGQDTKSLMTIRNIMPELKEIASQIRRDIVRMVHGASSGHPGGSLGCADFFTALYFKVMTHNPAFDMNAAGEDVFFLSNGHISPVFYSALARSGYFDVKELASFRKLNSRLQGHHEEAHCNTYSSRCLQQLSNFCQPLTSCDKGFDLQQK